MVEHSTADREVPGSNPGAPSEKKENGKIFINGTGVVYVYKHVLHSNIRQKSDKKLETKQVS